MAASTLYYHSLQHSAARVFASGEKWHILAWSIFLALIVLYVYRDVYRYFSRGVKRKCRKFSKRYVTDSDYHRICKSQTHLCKDIKNGKAEITKLRAKLNDKAKLQARLQHELQLNEQILEKSKAESKAKEFHIVHLTRKCAKLESALCAEANLKEKLIKEEKKVVRLGRENEDLKERVADLECTLAARRRDSISLEEKLNNIRLQSEKLSKERDSEAKRADQLEAQLKEAQKAKDQLLEVDHFKSPVLNLSIVSPSDFVCIRSSYVYKDTTREEKTDTCDQSVFGDTISPPEDYMGHNSQLVVGNNRIQEGPNTGVVIVGHPDEITQGFPSEVSCDSDDRENVPYALSLYSASYVIVAPVVHSPPV